MNLKVDWGVGLAAVDADGRHWGGWIMGVIDKVGVVE